MCKTNSLPPDPNTESAEEFAAVLAEIAATPERLADFIAAIPGSQWTRRPAAGGFSLVEHLCHLRDLETEGYRARVERILAEERPRLSDFEGDRIARERDYPSQDLRAAERAFRETRDAVVLRLAALMPEERRRTGILEGVGEITIAGLVAKMREHDREHLAEMAALRNEINSGKG